jgi:hypothetical protein
LGGIILIKLLTKSGVRPFFAYGAVWLFSIALFGEFSYVYFQMGMIEPLATLFLLLVFWVAQNKQPGWLVIAAVITTSLRLDYAGPTLAAILLFSAPLLGPVKTVWKDAFNWLARHWMQTIFYAFIILIPTLSVIAFYQIVIPDYWLNAKDTHHGSIYSILDGWVRITMGGSRQELYSFFTVYPLITILTTSILSLGTLVGVLTMLIRPGPIQKLDLRWSIILVGFFTIYIFVRPTVYPPRYSTPLLPLALIFLVTLLEHVIVSRRLKIT